jgi:hypothetical protein
MNETREDFEHLWEFYDFQELFEDIGMTEELRVI